MFDRIKRYTRKPWVIALAVVVLAIGGLIIRNSVRKTAVKTIEVKAVTVQEEVNATGKVVPFERADVGFEKGGTIAAVYVRVGDKVRRGAILAALSDAPTRASLLAAQASVRASEANLADDVSNSKIDYTNAERAALNSARDAYVKIDTMIVRQIDTFFRNGQSVYPVLTIATETYARERDIEEQRVAVGKILAEWKRKIDASNPDDAEDIIGISHQAVETTNALLIALTAEVTRIANASADKTTTNGYLETINSANTTLASAKSVVTSAENGLNSARPKSTQALKAKIDQARAEVANYEAQYAKSLIIAPFDGIVTRIDLTPGDIVGASQAHISIMGNQAFKIEANIAEADIAKVAVGQKANVTLDAYGPDVIFGTTVIAIDPAETIIDGVPTYRTTFQFDTNDVRIKSGMTADIDIIGRSRQNVLAVPQRVIITRNGKRFVIMKSGDTTSEIQVTTGLRGSDGLVEIVSGLEAGDLVVINPTK